MPCINAAVTTYTCCLAQTPSSPFPVPSPLPPYLPTSPQSPALLKAKEELGRLARAARQDAKAAADTDKALADKAKTIKQLDKQLAELDKGGSGRLCVRSSTSCIGPHVPHGNTPVRCSVAHTLAAAMPRPPRACLPFARAPHTRTPTLVCPAVLTVFRPTTHNCTQPALPPSRGRAAVRG